MVLYARRDVCSVSIPRSSGGCGETHIRPVHNGAPAEEFRLTCPLCESYLKGDHKPKILRTTPGNKETGTPAKQERVADSDPMWSSTPDTIPLTPDEIQVNHVIKERGEQQLKALESLIALKSAGIDITTRPDVLFFLRKSGLTDEVIQGAVLCPTGHSNTGGVKFCGECGASMSGERQEITVDDIPLDRLHIATLRKKCRDAGFSDKGRREELIARLT